jgi:diguanylate cyclase (GGDEF)-like protein
MLDIDHFKDVNDTYGHAAGDIVLVAISDILRQMVRADDLLIRWGGEEFLIILIDTSPDFLDKFALSVLQKIESTPLRIHEDTVIYKTCTIGFVEMPLYQENPKLLGFEQIINISDYAMYNAKEHGRNCAARFSPIKPCGTDAALLNYLTNLAKSVQLNEDYFKLSIFRNVKA